MHNMLYFLKRILIFVLFISIPITCLLNPGFQASKSRIKSFYKNVSDYWEVANATDEQMLGGESFYLGPLDIQAYQELDILTTKTFLKELMESDIATGKSYVLDCGCGTGRVTRKILLQNFDNLDLLDQNEKFLNIAYENLGYSEKIKRYIKVSLQNYKLPQNKYDIIFCQGILKYLVDDDILEFFKTARKSLKEKGLIIVKEITFSEMDHAPILFIEDVNIVRTLKTYKHLAYRAGLGFKKLHMQKMIQNMIWPVHIIAIGEIDPCYNPLNYAIFNMTDCRCPATDEPPKHKNK